jgi:hypothetical protein
VVRLYHVSSFGRRAERRLTIPSASGGDSGSERAIALFDDQLGAEDQEAWRDHG